MLAGEKKGLRGLDKSVLSTRLGVTRRFAVGISFYGRATATDFTGYDRNRMRASE